MSEHDKQAEEHRDTLEEMFEFYAMRLVLAFERLARAHSSIAHTLANPIHPKPGNPLARLFARLDQLEKNVMSQGQDLLAAVGRVQDAISPLADKVTEVGGEVQQVINLLTQPNPDVTAAIDRLNATKTALDTLGSNLQGVDDALDATLGTGGGSAGAPTISGFAPTSGAVGSAVAIMGTNLVANSQVQFGSAGAIAVTDAADDGSTCNAVVPSDATTGPITVSNAGGSATSTDEFTVT
jgi:hypothetical protein